MDRRGDTHRSDETGTIGEEGVAPPEHYVHRFYRPRSLSTSILTVEGDQGVESFLSYRRRYKRHRTGVAPATQAFACTLSVDPTSFAKAEDGIRTRDLYVGNVLLYY